VHDAILIEQLGVPAACVITDGFAPTARVMAEFDGLPDYPFVVIAHPISDNTDAQLHAKAEEIVRQAVAIFLRTKTAIQPDKLADGLATIREILRADSSDVEVVSCDDGTARLRLVLGAGCEECVMPRSFLEPMLLQHIQRSAREVKRVELEDPRDHDG
jgi:Fe-S cluster biogenesis protein NfuA